MKSESSTKKQFTSMDEYISTFTGEVKNRLTRIRQLVREIVPDAEETISYQIPTFKLNGNYLIYFAGYKDHVSIHPVPSGSESFNKQISRFQTGKGTLRFPLDKPLPLPLIKKIVQRMLHGNLDRYQRK